MAHAALRARLRHVYWIGGGSGAGKSVIARRLAARHGLRRYATDDVMPDHASQPEEALRNLLERDRMFTERLAEETRRLDLRVINVDTAMTEDLLTERVMESLGL
jgi:dephospho-CoA kinase